ncbi:hypothetical protein [Dyadobacter sp. 676]|uniref:Type IX secretion system membrane protein PorP/SprF n=1 Tax=Dyadobacter sp. 676 TaxID=3088362 RepID=A0AAU8FNH5_9BACT
MKKTLKSILLLSGLLAPAWSMAQDGTSTAADSIFFRNPGGALSMPVWKYRSLRPPTA